MAANANSKPIIVQIKYAPTDGSGTPNCTIDMMRPMPPTNRMRRRILIAGAYLPMSEIKRRSSGQYPNQTAARNRYWLLTSGSVISSRVRSAPKDFKGGKPTKNWYVPKTSGARAQTNSST